NLHYELPIKLAQEILFDTPRFNSRSGNSVVQVRFPTEVKNVRFKLMISISLNPSHQREEAISHIILSNNDNSKHKIMLH
ncbi:hypothetical protein L9F63_014021, partial [Diploptera punctata]